MKPRNLIAVGVVASLVLVGWLFTRDSAPESADLGLVPGRMQGDLKNEHETNPLRREAYGGGVTAQAGRWRLRFELGFKGPGVADGETMARATFEGVLSLSPSGDPSWLAGKLERPLVKVDPALESALGLARDEPARGLDLPFMWKLGPDGIEARSFAPDMPVGARNMLSALASGLQIVGADAGEAAWDVDEIGPGGAKQRAHYTQRGAVLTKTWRIEDGRSPHAAPDSPAPVITEARTDFVHRDQGQKVQLDRATYRLTLTADVSLEERQPTRYRSETSAELVALGPADAWGASLMPDQFEAEDEAIRRPAAKPKRVAKSERSPSELLAASAEAHSRRDVHGRRALMKELAASMRADDEAVDAVAAELGGPLADEVDVRTMVEALASAGTPHALTSMTALLDDAETPHDHRRLLASAAGWIGAPSPDLLDALRKQAWMVDGQRNAIATAALLALATQARLQSQRGTPLGEDLIAEITARAKSALSAPTPETSAQPASANPAAVTSGTAGAVAGGTVTPGTRPTDKVGDAAQADWLDALGAIGGANTWPLVEPYLDASSPRVRRTAVAALRFIDTAPARQALAAIMTTHTDPWTRREAVETVRYQRPSVFTATVVRVLATDEHKSVRVAAANTLAVWGYDEPALYDHLREALVREADPNVRAIITGLLPTRRVDAEEPTPTITVSPAP